MNANRQNGMVLLVSLMLLLMLTIIAITASNSSTLQLRIASNAELKAQAFQKAELGLASWTAAYLADTPTTDETANYRITQLDEKGDPLQKKNAADTALPERPSIGQGLGIGTGLRQVTNYDIRSEGGYGCSSGLTGCQATAIHLQGGQRAGDIQ